MFFNKFQEYFILKLAIDGSVDFKKYLNNSITCYISLLSFLSFVYVPTKDDSILRDLNIVYLI